MTRVTGLATYTVPKIDVLVSGTFRSEQGAPLAANFVVTNAMVLPHARAQPVGAGRQRHGEPDRAGHALRRSAERGGLPRREDRLRFGRTRTNVGVDIYNLFNANPALTYNAAYSAALPFPRPTGVLTPRFAKISAQIDF